MNAFFKTSNTIAISLILGLFFFLPSLEADVFHLKNGNKIKGTVLSQDKNWIRVRVRGGVIYVRKSDLLRHQKDDETSKPLISRPKTTWSPSSKSIRFIHK